MFITPMKPLSEIHSSPPVNNAEERQNSSSFLNIFQDAVDNLKETEAAVQRDTELMATGQIDDLHTLGINATKAYLAERLVIELRNRALDAYSEIMRLNV